jgi:hypothetical protein
VLPSPAMHGAPYGYWMNTQASGYFALAARGKQCADGAHRLVRQLRSVVSLSLAWMDKPELRRFFLLCARREKAKIPGTVVCLDAVFVVNLKPGRSSPNEGSGDKLMNRNAFLPSGSRQNHGWVASIKSRAQRPPSSLTADTGTLSPHSPQVRHGVSLGKLRDRDRSPFLGGSLFVSHREPPSGVPVVRLGLDVLASGRAALHCTSTAPSSARAL